MDFIKAYEKIEDVWKELPITKKRRRRRFYFRIWKYLVYFLAFVLAVFLVWAGITVWNLKNYYTYTVQGKTQLERAIVLTKKQDFSQAGRLAGRAKTNFSRVTSGLEDLRSNILIDKSPFLSEQIDTYRDLSEVALLLSQSLERGALFGTEAQKLIGEEKEMTFSNLTLKEKQKLLRLLYESLPELRGIKGNLDLALMKLEKVDTSRLLPFLKPRVENIKQEMRSRQKEWSRALQVAPLIPALAGYPDRSSFLVLFQNNTELRPTGGFLGTYGIMQTRQGEIPRFETHNIYHMDMPLEGKMRVEPPGPIAQYLNPDWYMRDSNWSPHWPEAASQIEWFYHKENKMLPPQNRINNFQGVFDGVIGITPEVAADLLSLTGPVEVEGERYNSDNLVDLLQYQVEKGYKKTSRTSWERKEVVGGILKKLKIKLFNLPAKQWSRMLDILNENLTKKNILLYFKNDHHENLVQDLGWGGSVKDFPQDYLMVVDSNMAALKTDAAIERSVSYSLDKGVNGMFADVNIRYSHNQEPSWKISEYKSYTRILVPRGSELLEADRKNLSPSQEEAGINKKNIHGKTSFGTYLRLAPKEIGKLHLKYKLPSRVAKEIKETGSYELLLQKQPGTVIKDSSIDINLDDKIKSYQPKGFSASLKGEKSVEWKSDITGDKKIKIKLKEE